MDPKQIIWEYGAKDPGPKTLLGPEGAFYTVFHPEVYELLKKPVDLDFLDQATQLFGDRLTISLTEKGFVKAAERPIKGQDDTHYDAIWVRDSVWVYFTFIEEGDREKAHRLLGALWDYYAQPKQLERFHNILKNPSLAADPMLVPHIRFDGARADLGDVQIDGQDQHWNHKQNDAHGFFLSALSHSFLNGIMGEKDLTPLRIEALLSFPVFFKSIDYPSYADSGAWEEIERINTSSITMVVKGLQGWHDVLTSSSCEGLKQEIARTPPKPLLQPSLDPHWVAGLIAEGLATIKNQLAWGGESPSYPVGDVRFRELDAALFNLFLPSPLLGLEPELLEQTLISMQALVRPLGILRYEKDSYQSGNYWLFYDDEERCHATEASDSEGDFLKRFEHFIPHTEAQWFFDSKWSMMYLEQCRVAKDAKRFALSLNKAKIHLKRAMAMATGNFSGTEVMAADGSSTQSLLLPESINTVILKGQSFYLPSPIAPLNWAIASLRMSLGRMRATLSKL